MMFCGRRFIHPHSKAMLLIGARSTAAVQGSFQNVYMRRAEQWWAVIGAVDGVC